VSRRECLCNLGRLTLLRWRLMRGTALPGFAMSTLAALDRWATRLHQGDG
jgi:hypothetical protein